MPEDAPHGVSATEDAGFSRRPKATMATYIHAHVLLVPSTLVLPEQSLLKDPLFLASSTFVKKPPRIVALSLVMVLCLLVYRLAEHRLRTQLAVTGQTVPNQLKQPTDRPTMRWMFQCFEGISLVRFTLPNGPPHHAIAGLEPLHERVVALLGPSCENLYKVDA
jgi:hypothetical protein